MDDFIEGLLSIRIDRIFPITPKIPIVLNSIPPIAKSKMRKFAVNQFLKITICLLNRVGPRFMSSSQINTRPPFSINIHFSKSLIKF